MKIGIINVSGDSLLGPLVLEKIAMLRIGDSAVLISLHEGFAKRNAAGIKSAYGGDISGGEEDSLLGNANIVVVAGVQPQGQNMSTHDFVGINKKRLSKILENISKYAPNAKIILALDGSPDKVTLILSELDESFGEHVLVGGGERNIFEFTHNVIEAIIAQIERLGD